MRIAVEDAGAERGLLVLLRGDEPQIEAEGRTGHSTVEVVVRQAAVMHSDLPLSALHYVIRTRERVVLDDASIKNLYSEDEYVREKRPRSVLCLPIVKQTKLVGALYLENNLTPRAFTPDRVEVLEVLASQAAISLENANLYSDLHRSEAFLAQGQSISHTGSLGWRFFSGETYCPEETYNIFEYDRTTKPTLELALQRDHPDDRSALEQLIERVSREKTEFDFHLRLMVPARHVKYLRIVSRRAGDESGRLEFVGAVTDITESNRAEDAVGASEKTLRLNVDRIAA